MADEDRRDMAETAESASRAATQTSEAARTTQKAAQATAVAARATKSSAERTTELAADRTALAFERTYAAWVRTGLMAMASGVGAPRLLEGTVHPGLAGVATVTLLAFSVFCFCAAVWRVVFRIVGPAPEVPHMPGYVLLAVNAVLAATAVAALAGVVVGW